MAIDRSIVNEATPIVWCPGCGYRPVLRAFEQVMDNRHIPRYRVAIVGGIGCSGRAYAYVDDVYGFHGTHGRALPTAQGLKFGNRELYVFVFCGDGDTASIGTNHLIHAARRDVPLGLIIFNNFNFGMTGGQASPTTPMGTKTGTSPYGVDIPPLDIGNLVVAAGGSFYARGSVPYGPEHLQEIIGAMVDHSEHGFAVVEIRSPLCERRLGGPIALYGKDAIRDEKELTSLEHEPNKIPLGILHHKDRLLRKQPILETTSPDELVRQLFAPHII